MKLGYGTYGMKHLDIFEVLPRLKRIGYDAVEIAVAPGWPTDPDVFGREDRIRLAALFEELQLPSPVLLGLMHPCLKGEARKEMLRGFAAACALARDLHAGDGPAIVTSTLGKHEHEWDTGKERMAQLLSEVASTASDYNVIFAAEPHVGGAWDSPDKAVWMMEAVDHPHLKLNFDISHYAVQGMDVARCVKLCVPYAVHCHVKDGWMQDGKVKFGLPGEGNFDYPAFFSLLRQQSLQVPVTVEVSAMVSRRELYDPWQSAAASYVVLQSARQASGE